MKKLIMTMTVLASLLLTLGVAQSIDLQEADALSAEKKVGVSLDTPDGTVPQPDGWLLVYPQWVFTHGESQSLTLKSTSGDRYRFTVLSNQIALTACAASNRTILLYVEGGYISQTGCFAFF